MTESYAVIGLGVSGISAVRFLTHQGKPVVGIDNMQIPLDLFDVIVVSPGIPRTHPLYLEARRLGKKIIGEAELACASIQQRVIGITGTNGKTSVKMMVTHILNTVGIAARALGNEGVPLTAELREATLGSEGVVVAELSSYQLETLSSRCLDVAALLNITPDHLERYDSFQEYRETKKTIFHCLKHGARCFTSEQYGESGECVLDGADNLAFVYALCEEFGVTRSQCEEALLSYTPLPHRIEYVSTVDGVRYYNDSKGTNVAAVVRAVESMEGDVLLIVGGRDKGTPYTPWVDAFRGRVKQIFAIGEAAQKIYDTLEGDYPVFILESLEDAVDRARAVAQPGQTVLLSPGCSSLDQFKNYEFRGNEFKRCVNLSPIRL